MTREIKFRAWDKTDKRWLESQEFSISGNGGIQTFGVYHPCDVMQFTGLLDKNGREIYEGDIIKTMMHYADDDGNPVDGQEKTFTVKWVESKGMQYVGLSLFPCDDIYQLEIIGNIYENPELISKMRNNKTDV